MKSTWEHAGFMRAQECLLERRLDKAFYCPTAVADSKDIERSCEGCQFYARQTQLLAQVLQTIPITWPFAVWGLDLVGPLKQAPEGFMHLLGAVEKFSSGSRLGQ